MKTKMTQQFISDCDRAKIYVETDMPIGVFHDFLMQVKGAMVERMIQAHKDQQKEIDDQLAEEPKEEESKVE